MITLQVVVNDCPVPVKQPWETWVYKSNKCSNNWWYRICLCKCRYCNIVKAWRVSWTVLFWYGFVITSHMKVWIWLLNWLVIWWGWGWWVVQAKTSYRGYPAKRALPAMLIRMADRALLAGYPRYEITEIRPFTMISWHGKALLVLYERRRLVTQGFRH